MGLIKTSLMSETYAIAFSVAVCVTVGSVWVFFPWLLPSRMVMIPLVAAWGLLQRKIAAGPSCFSFGGDKRKQSLFFNKNEVAIVTGANSGIGYYTALRLAEMGCKVVITCRTDALVQETISRMKAEFETRKIRKYAARGIKTVDAIDIVGGFTLELDSKQSIEAFVAKYVASKMPLHILVNNAGMMVKPLQFSKQNVSLELHTAVNFLGPLMLTELLLPTVKASKGRVVNVASEAHRMPEMLPSASGRVTGKYVLDALKQLNRGEASAAGPLAFLSVANAFGRYGASKLCNVYHAHYIATKHRGVPVCSLHPGCVATGFTRGLLFPWVKRIFDVASLCFIKSNEEGAETTIYCCMVEESVLKPLPDPKNPRVMLAPYFVDCADETRRLLRPLGWDGDAALETVYWGLETIMGEAKKNI